MNAWFTLCESSQRLHKQLIAGDNDIFELTIAGNENKLLA